VISAAFRGVSGMGALKMGGGWCGCFVSMFEVVRESCEGGVGVGGSGRVAVGEGAGVVGWDGR